MKKSVMVATAIFLLIAVVPSVSEADHSGIKGSLMEERSSSDVNDQAQMDIYGSTEGFFTENKGQWDQEFRFIGETSFGHIGIGKDCVYFDLKQMREIENPTDEIEDFMEPMDSMWSFDPMDLETIDIEITGHVVKYSFKGPLDADPIGMDPLDHHSNYFYGNDPDKWVTGVFSYRSVLFKGIYSNIDLRYYFNQDGLKYDFILNPGSDPRDILITIEGQNDISILENSIEIGFGNELSLRDSDLRTYYEDDPEIEIGSAFRLCDSNTYSFKLDPYDGKRVVVIDPLIFSTFIGADGQDEGRGLIIDESENVIMSGKTGSTDFPTTSGAYDCTDNGDDDNFLLKINSNGTSLLFSTYFGGNGNDGTMGLAFDSNGNICVSGSTWSSDFPTTSGAFDTTFNGGTGDAYLMKFNSNGSTLICSTYIGGNGNDGAQRLCLDSDDNMYISGSTESSNFPTTSEAYDTSSNGDSDIFVTKIDSLCYSIDFSTYIGGSDYESSRGIIQGSDGDIYIIGDTLSSDFPTTSGAYDITYNGDYDGIVSKISSDGSDLLLSTYIGGSGRDRGFDISLDSYGNVICLFITSLDSDDFPTTSGAYDTTYNGAWDVVVSKLDPTLSSLVFSTFFGGSGSDQTMSFYMDRSDNIWIGGTTSSSDLPISIDAYDNTYSYNDGFLSCINRTGDSLIHSTFFGGLSDERLNFLMALPCQGGIGVIFTGSTGSSNFPISSGAYDTTLAYGKDAFISKLSVSLTSEPLEVYSIDIFSRPDFIEKKDLGNIGDRIYIELIGLDGNESNVDFASVDVIFNRSIPQVVPIFLMETGLNTGVYQGIYKIPARAIYLETLNFSVFVDRSKYSILLVDIPFRPSEIYSLKLFSDDDYLFETDKIDVDEDFYIEVVGVDTQPSNLNFALVNLTSEISIPFQIVIPLLETGPDTGIYRSNHTIARNMVFFENITIYSARDPSKFVRAIHHTPVQIRPFNDTIFAYEDEMYLHEYWNFGYGQETWLLHTDAEWLQLGEGNHTLYGIPRNCHVGIWNVTVTISDDRGHFDTHIFDVEVINAPPRIMTEDVLDAYQNEYYSVDYDIDDDDDKSTASWKLETNATWLLINETNGILNGTPGNDDVGLWPVIVSVNDGYDSWNRSIFQLSVHDVNDLPVIISEDIMMIHQGDRYRRDYEAFDIDRGDSIRWEFFTNASFLDFDYEFSVLSGTPGNEDVGTWLVNVTAVDERDGMDSRNFLLKVINVNDNPTWDDIPDDSDVVFGEIFGFDVNATDIDVGDIVGYSIRTEPEVGMAIDPDTGVIEWEAIYLGNPTIIGITIIASDGEFNISHEFDIEVIPSPPPISEIISPSDGKRVSSQLVTLEWSGTDIEGDDLIYDLYLHEGITFINALREEARIKKNFNQTRYGITGLNAGMIYFWTVVPNDGCSHGECVSGIFSFEVNMPPTVSGILNEVISVGDRFELKVKGADKNPEDRSILKYRLAQAPDGMAIDEDSGMITWKPGDDQVGKTTVIFEVSDGIDLVSGSFEIKVNEAEEGNNLAMILTILGFCILALGVIVIAVILMFLRKRQQVEEAEEEVDEIESHYLDEDDEEGHDTAMGKRYRDVPISSTEAYQNMQRSDHKLSYDELYNGGQEESLEEHIHELEMQELPSESVEDLERILDEENHPDGPKPTEDMDIEAISTEDPYDHQEYVEG